jgi:succinoglycan biosynthesis transport protein ExoP
MNMPAGREFRGATSPLQPELETHDFVRYWRAVNRNKWRILLLMIAVGTLAALYAHSLPPVYRATATMMLEASRQKALSNEEVFTAVMGSSTRDYFQTQAEILKSREFAQRLVRVMNLTRHPEYDPRRPPPPPWYARLIPEQLLPSSAPRALPSDEEIEEAVVGQVMQRISVQPVRNTQLVRLSFDSHDPEIAGNVPNTLAMIYIVTDSESRNALSRRAFSFLSEQGEGRKKKLADSERALQDFRERERIVDLKNAPLSGAGRQFEQLTTSLLEAKKKRADVEVLYAQVTAARQKGSLDVMDNLPAISTNPLVQQFKVAEAEAERRLGDASKRYGPEHPRFIAAQADLKAAQENLRRQVAAVVQTVSKDYEVAKSNEEAMERAVARARSDVQGQNRKEFELSSLEREVASNRQIYEQFMQRAREIRIGDMESQVARIVDEARKPKWPVGPNTRFIIVMALLATLAAGILLSVMLERLDNTVKATHEVESKLGVKSVGIVQYMRPERGARLERMFLQDKHNAFSESIRTIRSDVLLSMIDTPQKILLLTSAVPHEGKTTVSCNLAFALSEVARTVLVEADMRRPKIDKVFDERGSHPGLSELVAGRASLHDCLYQPEDSSLQILQAGRVPLNPLELLSSKRFAEVLNQLATQFDVVLMDTAPVQLVSDALVLSKMATAVLLVVKADDTPYPVVRNTITRLMRADAPLLGAVLNQIDLEHADAYHGEYSGYGNAYYRKYGYFDASGTRTPSAKG